MLAGVSALGVLAASPAEAQQISTQGADAQPQVYDPPFFMRFAPKTAADMVKNVPGFQVSAASGARGFGQARQNVLINGRRVSGKSNDAETALSRIAADSVVRIEIVDGATLNIPGLSGQVANVIAKVDAFSGSWEFTPQFRENLRPAWYRGSISANGRTEGGWSWSAALELDDERNGNEGPTVIADATGQVSDIRREAFNGSSQEPELDATLTYEAVDGAIANLNIALRDLNFVGREDSFRNPVNGPRESRFAFFGEDERGGEVGADYEFDLGPGRLKLIGLHSQEDGVDLITVESYDAAGANVGGERVVEDIAVGESILRGEYGFSAFEGDVQIAAEGAFNFLDVVTEIGERQADGAYPMTLLPDGTARVEEARAETNLSYSRALDAALSLQSSVGVEYSELSQTGAGGLTREFVRPKGFVSLAWRPDETFDVNVKAERRVGQLNFGDFLSSIDIQNNNQSSGNAELVPEQRWVASTEINRNLGAWGAVKLSAEYSLIEDVVDRIPIDENGFPVLNPSQNTASIAGQGVGNIDKATSWSATGSGTINFDPVGARGLQLSFSLRYADSEVDDPLTGLTREISYSDKLNGRVALRWDIPETSWSVVGGVEEYQDYRGYRLDQIEHDWGDPSLSFLAIENKDVFGMSMQLEMVNLSDTSENYRREVYQRAEAGAPRLRTNALDFTEERRRTFGPIVRFNVAGAF
jgi:hypothetical protein